MERKGKEEGGTRKGRGKEMKEQGEGKEGHGRFMAPRVATTSFLYFNGHFRNLNWRYLPYIRPI